jgi:murein DD-endopeptidase MepM/ murein hydrolase activator NlpD
MANKMVANIKSLSDGVTGLTKHINELYAALAKVNTVAGKTLKDAKSAVNTVGGAMNLGKASTRVGTGADGANFAQPAIGGGGNLISRSMGKFSSFAQSPGGQAATIGAGMGFSIAAGAYAATPDASLTLQRSVGYYQAGLRSPGINRNQLERATFSAMGGGLSSVGSDSIVAAMLAGRGYTPGSANYKQAVSQVGGAYKYLGMENAAATQAIAGFQTGAMGANLFQYGITTTTAGGKEKTTGEIAKELMNYMTGGAKVSAEDVRRSYQKGALGANLSTMGFDAAQQEILYQSMIDIASGRNPDLSKAKPMAGNENTALTAAGRMASSQTSLMTKAENSMIKGFENAADTVEAFNRQLANVIEPLGQLKGYLGGVGGTNAGKGISTAGAGIAGLLKKAVGVGLIGAAGAGEIFSLGLSTPVSAAAAVAGTALLTGKGGAGTGYGASFGVSNRGRTGGSSPVAGAAVSAGYGATDNSGVWASTGGTHTGMDYAVAKGTPVTVAYADGVVSQVDINSDYGTSVMIDHADGTQTIYGHLSERSVKVGDAVKLGQRIGKSGESGNANGPHLHFEMRKGKNNPVDPSKYVSGGSTNALLNLAYASILPTSADITDPKPSSSNAARSNTATNAVAPAGPGQTEWAKAFLTSAGAPLTKDNIYAITEWARFESGRVDPSINNNPLNTTLDMPGAVARNKVGVKKYVDAQQGISATLATLTGNRANERGYTAVLEGLKAGVPYTETFKNIQNSAWVKGEKGKSPYEFNFNRGPSGGGTTGYGASIPTTPTALATASMPTTTSVTHGNKTVNVTLKIERATEQEAMKFAKLIKTYLDNDNEISRMGSS